MPVQNPEVTDSTEQVENNTSRRKLLTMAGIGTIAIGGGINLRPWDKSNKETSTRVHRSNQMKNGNFELLTDSDRMQKINDQTVGTLPYLHNNAGEYNPDKNRTYFTYRAAKDEVTVQYYDHGCHTLSSRYKAAIYPLIDDNHGEPSMTVDEDGYIHLFYGSHVTPLQYAQSKNPHDIQNWKYMGASLPDDSVYPHQETRDSAEGLAEHCNIEDMPNGTYPIPEVHNNDLYVIYRTGRENYRAHGSLDNTPEDPADRTFYPDHEFATIIRSLNRGKTWADMGSVIDTSGFIGKTESQTSDYFSSSYTGADAYITGFELGPNENYIHITWITAVGEGGNPHNNLRKNVYHVKWKPETATCYNLNNTDMGDEINKQNHSNSYIRAFKGLFVGSASHYIDGNQVLILTKSFDDSDDELKWYYSKFSNGSWSKANRVGTALTNHSGNSGSIRINDDGAIEAHLIDGDGSAVGVVSSKKPNTSKSSGGRGGAYKRWILTNNGWVKETLAAGFHNGNKVLGTKLVRNGTDEFAVLSAESGGNKSWWYRDMANVNSCS
jgi:hypothetical protein